MRRAALESHEDALPSAESRSGGGVGGGQGCLPVAVGR